jgi:hypothetical protein
METVVLRSVMMALPDADESTAQKTEKFWEAAQVFFDWEQKVMIAGAPSAEQKQDHRAMLRLLTLAVGFARKLEPKSQSLEMLKIRLDDSWGMFYSPMTEQEADSILAAAFPE